MLRHETKEVEVKDKLLQFNIDLGLKEKKYAKNFNNGEYMKSVDVSDKFKAHKLDIAN